jgi:hypothetical protein
VETEVLFFYEIINDSLLDAVMTLYQLFALMKFACVQQRMYVLTWWHDERRFWWLEYHGVEF